jgi:7,8-dihydropterin-6-yl-methyl-4-(beta-D-ribofuranosyl)aminobenzene 5'-phosphate synthase
MKIAMKTLCLTTLIMIIWSMCCFGESGDLTESGNGAVAHNVVFTVLCDNTSQSDSIFADHGFSCLIESGDQTCLFDAGNNPEKFMANVGKLDVDCSAIDHVFISHIHGDHMGGLSPILEECNRPTLCMPVSYPRPGGESFGDRADADFSAMLEELKPFVYEVIQSREPATFGRDFHTTGVIDNWSYEQALIFPTPKGLIIITGCAHPGIVDIARHAREVMRQDVHFVMGGFHLMRSDSAHVDSVAQELRQLTRYIGPCHCTGEKARAIIKSVFREDYVDVHAGLRLQLPEDNIH